jgi:hypothetical protein
MASWSRVRPVVEIRSSVKTLTPTVWPGTDAIAPSVPTTKITQP